VEAAVFVWDPQQYRQFAGPRSRPFGDLVAQIGASAPRHVLDLGCGDGELTATLTRRWPSAQVIGLDSSAEMLARAASRAGPQLAFRQADVAAEPADPHADVVVSNALFQWLPEHVEVFQRWIAAMAPGAWFAFQVPGNFAAPSHELMRELVAAEPWASLLPAGVLRHEDAVRTPAEYSGVFLNAGWGVDAWETTYTHLLGGPDPVLEWVRGTGLRPVLAALPPDRVRAFEAEYATRLRQAYPPRDDGLTPFEFRRVFCVAHRPGAGDDA
jgi:trans-aconitate 2-methyltransferase